MGEEYVSSMEEIEMIRCEGTVNSGARCGIMMVGEAAVVDVVGLEEQLSFVLWVISQIFSSLS